MPIPAARENTGHLEVGFAPLNHLSPAFGVPVLLGPCRAGGCRCVRLRRPGAVRGGHAHRSLQQLLVPLSGSFDVLLDDGAEKRTIHLNRPWTGILLTPMIWRELVHFSSGSVCMVLASAHYDESDYFREYDDFIAAVSGGA